MIFPISTLKSVTSTFGMDHDQRVIIKFLSNERSNASQITDKLQAKFGQYDYQLQIVNFWITEMRGGRQGLHQEIRSGRRPLDDVNGKSLAI
jgi:hypothetical protein